jgi:hypothetical protein
MVQIYDQYDELAIGVDLVRIVELVACGQLSSVES